MQLKMERRWTLVFLVVAISLVGIIQGWKSTQASVTIPVESSIEVTL